MGLKWTEISWFIQENKDNQRLKNLVKIQRKCINSPSRILPLLQAKTPLSFELWKLWLLNVKKLLNKYQEEGGRGKKVIWSTFISQRLN